MTKNRIYPDWIQAYLDFTDNTEPCKLYRTWAAISTISAVMQRKCWIDWERVLHPHMYIVLVSPPGKGRKGTTMAPVKEFLKELEIPMTPSSLTGAKLIEYIAKSTIEKRTVGGVALPPESSLTAFSEEFTVFLGKNQEDLMGYLIDWFDTRDEKWTRGTKTQGDYGIENICLNIFAATTNDELKRNLPRGSAGAGLLSRIVFVYAGGLGKRVPYPHLMKNDEGKLVRAPKLNCQNDPIRQKLTADLGQIHNLAGEFTLSQETLVAYGRWYSNLDETNKFFRGPLSSYTERRQTHLMKLAMLISASRSNDKIIEEQDFQKALSIMKRTEKEMPKAFSHFGEYDGASVMQEIIATIMLREEITFRELLTEHLTDVGNEQELTNILNTLTLLDPPLCRLEKEGNKTVIRYNKELI